MSSMTPNRVRTKAPAGCGSIKQKQIKQNSKSTLISQQNNELKFLFKSKIYQWIKLNTNE